LVQLLRVDPFVYLKNIEGDLTCLESGYHTQLQRQHLASCAQSVAQLSGALEALVEYALIEDDTFVSTKRPANVKSFLQRIAQPHQAPLAERGIEFIAEVDRELPPTIILDEFHLEMILTNLLGFALNQVPNKLSIMAKPGGGEAREASLLIEIKCFGVSNYSRLEIAEAADPYFGALLARKLLETLEWQYDFQRLDDSMTISLCVPFVSDSLSAT